MSSLSEVVVYDWFSYKNSCPKWAEHFQNRRKNLPQPSSINISLPLSSIWLKPLSDDRRASLLPYQIASIIDFPFKSVQPTLMTSSTRVMIFFNILQFCLCFLFNIMLLRRMFLSTLNWTLGRSSFSPPNFPTMRNSLASLLLPSLADLLKLKEIFHSPMWKPNPTSFPSGEVSSAKTRVKCTNVAAKTTSKEQGSKSVVLRSEKI